MKIDISFNVLGMIIYSCNHVKGYREGKGTRLCKKCRNKLITKFEKELKNASKII